MYFAHTITPDQESLSWQNEMMKESPGEVFRGNHSLAGITKLEVFAAVKEAVVAVDSGPRVEELDMSVLQRVCSSSFHLRNSSIFMCFIRRLTKKPIQRKRENLYERLRLVGAYYDGVTLLWRSRQKEPLRPAMEKLEFGGARPLETAEMSQLGDFDVQVVLFGFEVGEFRYQ
jgi:hypothetical protein